jgi:hypothetical protein
MIDQDIPDYVSSFRDSVILANRIRNYWLEKGKEVHVYVEKFMVGKSGPFYQIRSDINLKGFQNDDL